MFSRMDNKKRQEVNCTNIGQPSSGERSNDGTLQVPRPQAHYHHQRSPNNFKVIKTAKAFSNDTVTWSLKYRRNGADGYMDILDSSVAVMEWYIQRYRTRQRALKFNMPLHAHFEKAVDLGLTTVPPACLVTEQFKVYDDTVIEECLQKRSQQLQNRIECYEDTVSGWVLSNLVAVDITVWLLDQLRASTYHPLSKWVRNTKCVVNVKNKQDNKCFKYAVLTGLYKPTDPLNPSRVPPYTGHETAPDAPNFSMLTYPVTLRDIGKFKRINNISVNVYSVDKEKMKKHYNEEKIADVVEGEREKRKRSCKNRLSHKRQKLDFIDNETVLCGDCSEDEDESDMEDDIEALIDDSDDIEDDVAMYSTLEQQEQAAEIEQIQQRFVESIVSVNDGGSDDDGEKEEEKEDDGDSKRGIVYPVRTRKIGIARHVNLLFTEKEIVYHYTTVKNFNGFLRRRYSKYTGGKHFTAIRASMGLEQKWKEKQEMSVYCSKNM